MICLRLLITVYFSGNSVLLFEVGSTLAEVFHFLNEVIFISVRYNKHFKMNVPRVASIIAKVFIALKLNEHKHSCFMNNS